MRLLVFLLALLRCVSGFLHPPHSKFTFKVLGAQNEKHGPFSATPKFHKKAKHIIAAGVGFGVVSPQIVSAKSTTVVLPTRMRPVREGRRRARTAKKRAVVEIEIIDPEAAAFQDAANAAVTSSNSDKQKSSMLNKVGGLLVVGALVKTFMFDKSSKNKQKGKRKKISRRDLPPLDPFRSQSLSMEKGELRGMMSKLESKLSPKTPATTNTNEKMVEDSQSLYAPNENTDEDNGDDNIFADLSGASSPVATSTASRKSERLPKFSVKSSHSSALPSQEAFFEGDPEDLFTADPNEPIFSAMDEQYSPDSAAETKDDQETDEDDEDDLGRVPEEPSETAASEPKKKGILGRIFSRAGAGRPTDLRIALTSTADEYIIRMKIE